jgi:uncharacterized membrane protein
MTAFVIALVLLLLIASLWGADTRDGRDWQRRP